MRFLIASSLALSAALVATTAAPAGAAAPAAFDPAIYTVIGTVYADADADGAYSFGDAPVSGAAVALYASSADAAARTNPVRTLKTGALGTYSASALTAGTYYASASAAGYRDLGVAQTTVTGATFVGAADVAVRRVTDLTATVFEDRDGDGVKGPGEPNVNGKTIIFIDALKTKAAIESGQLASIDVGAAISAAVGGSLDLGAAIRFRTTSGGEPLTYSDVPSGAYIVLRSPFNLTLTDMIADRARITAFIDLISSGDASALLAMDPGLLDTGDISTTPNNEYLKKLASTLSSAVRTVESADTEKYLGSDLATQMTSAAGTVGQVAGLLAALPATHFAAVDRWGTAWSLTGLRPAKATDFAFGVRRPVSIGGTVYNDSNANGKKDMLDLAESVTLTVYDAAGNVLGSTVTPALIGTYKVDRLPYDTDLYLGLSGTTKLPSVRAAEPLPAALAGKAIVGSYRIAGTGVVNAISQDIGVASVVPLGTKTSAVAVSGATTLTLSNSNSAAVNVSYSVNGGSAQSTSVAGKGILGTAGSKSVAIAGLQPGENTILLTWTLGVYTGATQTVTVVR